MIANTKGQKWRGPQLLEMIMNQIICEWPFSFIDLGAFFLHYYVQITEHNSRKSGKSSGMAGNRSHGGSDQLLYYINHNDQNCFKHGVVRRIKTHPMN